MPSTGSSSPLLVHRFSTGVSLFRCCRHVWYLHAVNVFLLLVFVLPVSGPMGVLLEVATRMVLSRSRVKRATRILILPRASHVST